MSERAECPNRELNNRELCACPSKGCPNHGFCCACIENHRQAGNLPLCLRPPAK